MSQAYLSRHLELLANPFRGGKAINGQYRIVPVPRLCDLATSQLDEFLQTFQDRPLCRYGVSLVNYVYPSPVIAGPDVVPRLQISGLTTIQGYGKRRAKAEFNASLLSAAPWQVPNRLTYDGGGSLTMDPQIAITLMEDRSKEQQKRKQQTMEPYDHDE